MRGFSDSNPFSTGDGDYIDAESRLEKVKDFNAEQCHAALKLAIQKTVRLAIERRLRRLAKENK